MNIGEIGSQILKKIYSDEGMMMRETGAAVLSVSNPLLGAAATVGNTFLNNFNELKLRRLILGLSSGINIEQRMNELYNYATSSSQRAYAVGNVLKEAIASESPHVCELYGMILSKHIGENQTDFSWKELIVCRALESANDYDLNVFKEIMTNCIKETDHGTQIIYPRDRADEFEIACQWGLYNRLFTNGMVQGGDVILFGGGAAENDSDFVKSNFYVESPAFLLSELISELRRIWDYGQHS